MEFKPMTSAILVECQLVCSLSWETTALVLQRSWAQNPIQV